MCKNRYEKIMATLLPIIIIITTSTAALSAEINMGMLYTDVSDHSSLAPVKKINNTDFHKPSNQNFETEIKRKPVDTSNVVKKDFAEKEIDINHKFIANSLAIVGVLLAWLSLITFFFGETYPFKKQSQGRGFIKIMRRQYTRIRKSVARKPKQVLQNAENKVIEYRDFSRLNKAQKEIVEKFAAIVEQQAEILSPEDKAIIRDIDDALEYYLGLDQNIATLLQSDVDSCFNNMQNFMQIIDERHAKKASYKMRLHNNIVEQHLSMEKMSLG